MVIAIITIIMVIAITMVIAIITIIMVFIGLTGVTGSTIDQAFYYKPNEIIMRDVVLGHTASCVRILAAQSHTAASHLATAKTPHKNHLCSKYSSGFSAKCF